jgi:broad specificity phosphatase PhoE
LAWAQTAQPPATVLLIRHAEKLTDGQIHLSPQGFDRARAMPMLFGTAAHPLPVPQVLFASHQSKNSNRPVETITQLSEALKLPINSSIDDKDIAGLAKELLSGRYAGKVVLVAWHHGSIPAIARALGAVPPYDPWPDTQFDRLWKIDYKDGKATLTDVPQALMPGDSK